jgi:uncharacterized DUF497 family protein
MSISFECDPHKARANLEKHGVPFEYAVHVFSDPERLERHDGRTDYGEDRYLTIGLVEDRELVVVYTMRNETVRLISARKADRHEQLDYWKGR